MPSAAPESPRAQYHPPVHAGQLQLVFAVAAAIILFLFGIEHFSKEIQSVTGERFRHFLARGTSNRFVAFSLGAAVTAVIQSSTATSVIAVGLVNAGVVSFRQTLGVIFGANVGTTVTAQLVALELTDFAPGLILVGFITGLLPFRWRIFGRSIFYSAWCSSASSWCRRRSSRCAATPTRWPRSRRSAAPCRGWWPERCSRRSCNRARSPRDWRSCCSRRA